jgi:hypothetical protein
MWVKPLHRREGKLLENAILDMLLGPVKDTFRLVFDALKKDHIFSKITNCAYCPSALCTSNMYIPAGNCAVSTSTVTVSAA